MDAVSVAPFFYYSPDPQGRQQKQHGHHGQFLAQPHAYIPASTQLLSPIPISPVAFPSQLVLGGRGIPLTITPAASPSLIEQSYIPSEMCTESVTPDYFFNPATPPLTHSAVSTPSISYAMPTPISNHGWSSLDEPIIATVAPSEIQLATPVEFIPSGLPTPIVKSNASPPPSIALNDVHCPALSPCSSQSSFCDPRELSIQTPTPVEVRPDVVFPPMTSLGGDDDHFLFGGSVEDFLPTASSGIKTPLYMSADFNEELSDLGDSASEDDFINEFSKSIFSPSKRVKYEDDSDVEQLPSPPWSENSSREGSSAPSDCSENHSKRCKTDDDEMSEAERLKSFKFGSHSCSDSCDSPCEKPSSAVMAASRTVIRRGRKQSLTDDPTKTFVCHICTRRFRRQEHLKRHFRSLHTDDKPFKCTECNKSFSRSDNLTQHSRIHGTGAVVLGVLTEDEVPALGTAFLGVDTELSSPPLGIVVVDALTAAGEAKESKSSEDKKARRKRKRSDE